MAGEENLRPVHTKEEARERGRNGGIKSGQVRRQKKTIAATVEKLLDSKVTDPKQLEIIKKSGFPLTGKPTYRDFLVASTLMQTIKRGKVDDLLKLQQVIGERIEQAETSEGKLADLIDGLLIDGGAEE